MPDLKKPFSGGYAWNVPDTAFHGRHVLTCIDVGEKWPVAMHLAAREMVIECKDCGLQSSEVFGELQPQFSDVLCLKLFQVIHPFSKK
jgi:hypothetical protein